MRRALVVAACLSAACLSPGKPAQPAALAYTAKEADERLASVDRELQETGDALKSAGYALEPPRTPAQKRDAATVTPMSEDAVTLEWVLLKIGAMEQIGGDTSLPNPRRSRANVIAAVGEGLLAQHFATLWGKAEPGRRAVSDLRTAVDLDPESESAAVAYTLALLGVRNSGFRSHAEETVGVKTSPELERIAPLLDAHRDSLLAQTALQHALTELRDDGPLEQSIEQLRVGLDQRIAELRAKDARVAEDVDDRFATHQ